MASPETLAAVVTAKYCDALPLYFLGDAWFATKHILRMTIEHSLVAIVRMKKNKIKYSLVVDSKVKLLCAKALYKEHVKGHWQTLNHVPYQSKSIAAELNLASSD